VVRRQELERLARAHGVQPAYRDSHGRKVRVASDTLAAILAVLGDPPDAPADPQAAPCPSAPEGPAGRVWGFAVQLYSLRSRDSWGHGDLHDLAQLAVWSARDLGAGFVLVNPLHAAEPAPPVSPSPYLPMTRRYVSPLYLRVEDVPEYAQLPAADQARIANLGATLQTRNGTSELIDRDAVWAAKRAALELLSQKPQSHVRQAAFERYRRAEGEALQDWATWCALAEEYGPDYRAWPPGLAHPRSPAVARERTHRRPRVEFHAWLQWLADEQLASAQAAARAAGMPIGVIRDLAVGAHPGGADSWACQDVLAAGISTGAPPDEFNQLGQNWTQSPWHPQRLAARGYGPLRELVAASLRHAGALRVDHVMGLFRLWWVPAGMTPDRGAYVRYDHNATVGTLTSEATRAGAMVIGEDLGTVEPRVRGFLARKDVLGTSMLWFERNKDGTPRPAARWRRRCLATVGTHDMPPAASFITADHVALRARLGLLTRPIDTERLDADATIRAWRTMLRDTGLLPGDASPDTAAMTAALYRFLAGTPARLLAVSLPDAVGDRRPQNVPGTTNEYPNWRLPLTDGAGRAVMLEELPASKVVRLVVGAVTAGL